MTKTKAIGYLVIVGVALIIITPIVMIISNNIKERRLYKEGIKVEAIVKDSDRGRNPRTRIFYYSLTLDYKDHHGKSHSEEIQVDYDTYLANHAGKTTEILIDKEDPSSFTLVNTSEFYGTEERVVKPLELKEFHKSQDKEYILNKLNKISIGWTIQPSDSNTFMNEKRKSFLQLERDSITYFGDIRHDEELKRYIRKLKRAGHGKFYPGYLTETPFGKLDVPKQKHRIHHSYYLFTDGSYEFLMFNQIDYSHKAWVVISAKKIANTTYE